VISSDLCDATSDSAGETTVVMGIGGSQVAGKPVSCKFKIGQTAYTHKLVPISIPGKCNAVILGRDFMSEWGVTQFDWVNGRVKLGEDWVLVISNDNELDQEILSYQQADVKYSCGDNLSVHQKNLINQLVESQREVFAVKNKAPRVCDLGMHVIQSMDDRVYKEKVRRQPRKNVPIINAQVEEMLEDGICRHSKSPYNSNIHLVDKGDGTKRFVLDFRGLNANTKKDNYPLPNVQDIIESLKGSKFFTQIDLASGYWAIPLNEADKEKTAFSTPNGKYEMNVMTFGLVNAMATFQRKMDTLKEECKREGIENIEVYVDNGMIHSKTFQEHIKAIAILLRVMGRHKMSLREDKCQFAMSKIEFLGFVIDGETVKPSPKNVELIKSFPRPTTRKQLQRFVGMANFNRRFMEKHAEDAKPLTDLTSDKMEFQWGSAEEGAFKKIKNALSEESRVYIPDWSKEFLIRVDASDVALGGILYQIDDLGENKVIAYASKALKGAQRNWSATEKEFFAVVWITRHWEVYCTQSPVIYSDHLSIAAIRKKKDPRGKFKRWIVELEAVDCKLKFIDGKSNIEADCLSRVLYPKSTKDEECLPHQDMIYQIEDNNLYPSLDQIKKQQMKDRELKRAIEAIKENKTLKNGPYKKYTTLSVKDGILYKGGRIVVPDVLQDNLIKEFHGQQHVGADNTIELLKNRFYFRGMRTLVQNMVSKCNTCLQCKVSKSSKAEMVVMETPPPRSMIAMDMATLPMSSLGNNKYLMMVDMNTKFIVAVPMAGEKAKLIKSAFKEKWVPYFGLPERMITDQGKNFDGHVIQDLCDELNIKKVRSSTYHPEGNGSAEAAVKSLKAVIRNTLKSRNVAYEDWDTILQESVLAVNAMVNTSSQYTPFELMFGSNPRLPIDNLLQLPLDRSEPVPTAVIQKNGTLNRDEAKLSYKRQYDKTALVASYEVGQEVLLKRSHGEYPKVSVKWTRGPFIIARKFGPCNFGITGPDNFTKVVHHNLLKAAGAEVEATRTLSDLAGQSPDITHVEYIPIEIRITEVNAEGVVVDDELLVDEVTGEEVQEEATEELPDLHTATEVPDDILIPEPIANSSMLSVDEDVSFTAPTEPWNRSRLELPQVGMPSLFNTIVDLVGAPLREASELVNNITGTALFRDSTDNVAIEGNISISQDISNSSDNPQVVENGYVITEDNIDEFLKVQSFISEEESSSENSSDFYSGDE